MDNLQKIGSPSALAVLLREVTCDRDSYDQSYNERKPYILPRIVAPAMTAVGLSSMCTDRRHIQIVNRLVYLAATVN